MLSANSRKGELDAIRYVIGGDGDPADAFHNWGCMDSDPQNSRTLKSSFASADQRGVWSKGLMQGRLQQARQGGSERVRSHEQDRTRPKLFLAFGNKEKNTRLRPHGSFTTSLACTFPPFQGFPRTSWPPVCPCFPACGGCLQVLHERLAASYQMIRRQI